MQADLFFSPALHKLSKGVPSGPRGGILAEEMGLGKTVEILALVLAMPASPAIVSGTPKGSRIHSRGTLVVCKVSLVGQWVTEAKSKLADKELKIVEYHGSNRCALPAWNLVSQICGLIQRLFSAADLHQQATLRQGWSPLYPVVQDQRFEEARRTRYRCDNLRNAYQRYARPLPQGQWRFQPSGPYPLAQSGA